MRQIRELKRFSLLGLAVLSMLACSEDPANDGAANGAGGTTSQSTAGAPASTGGQSGSTTSRAATGGTSSVATSSVATGGTSSSTVTGTTGWFFGSTVESWAVKWVEPTGAFVPAVSFDSSVGDPLGGSLSVTAPFSAISQGVMVGVNTNAAIDLTGKTVTAKIRLDSGLSCGGFSGGAKLYVKWVSGTNWYYADSGWVNLTVSTTTFQTLTFNGSGANPTGYVDPAGTYDPTAIREVGVNVSTTGDTTAVCSNSAAVFHIDSVTY